MSAFWWIVSANAFWWIVSAIMLLLAVVIAVLEFLGLALLWAWLTTPSYSREDSNNG